MGIHKHHSTPVHLGGIGPIQLLEDRDHAYIHFRRFVNGKDRWFHGGLLKFLDPWDRITVRETMSERGSGEGNPMYGVEPTIKGWKWWTDGTKEILSEKQPGVNFVLGRIQQIGHNGSLGKTWFNNGLVEVQTVERPEGFEIGRLPCKREKQSKQILGRTWWNDGSVEVLRRDQPDGFVKGRLKG